MRLQYTFYESRTFKYHIELYQDGKLVDTIKVWQDELDDEIDRIERLGYRQGYTKQDIDRVKHQLDIMLEHYIEVSQ